MNTDSTIGKRLAQYAKSTFKSNAALARALQMDPGNLAKYTSGNSVPGGALLQKLAELGCNINWLLTGLGSPSYKPADRNDGADAGSRSRAKRAPAKTAAPKAADNKALEEMRKDLRNFELTVTELRTGLEALQLNLAQTEKRWMRELKSLRKKSKK